MQIDVHHDGFFLLRPIRYIQEKVFSNKLSRMSWPDLFEYIVQETGPFAGLYFLLPLQCGFETLHRLRYDEDCAMFFDLAELYGKMHIYVDTFGRDLSFIINKYPREVLNDGGADEGDDGDEAVLGGGHEAAVNDGGVEAINDGDEEAENDGDEGLRVIVNVFVNIL